MGSLQSTWSDVILNSQINCVFLCRSSKLTWGHTYCYPMQIVFRVVPMFTFSILQFELTLDLADCSWKGVPSCLGHLLPWQTINHLCYPSVRVLKVDWQIQMQFCIYVGFFLMHTHPPSPLLKELCRLYR